MGAVAAISIGGEVQGAVIERSASLSASTSISAAGEHFSILERSAALGAVAGISTTSLRVAIRSVSLSAIGAITTGAVRELQRAASLTAVGEITATGVAREPSDPGQWFGSPIDLDGLDVRASIALQGLEMARSIGFTWKGL